jgi:thiol-disulfide isomerase/thioredoxin
MRTIAIFIITILLCNHTLAQETEIRFEQGTWAQILEKAQIENKLIFLDAYAEWCGPCKWMAKNTFTDPEVAKFYNMNFVNAKIDMEKGEGVELAKKFTVRAYPTLLYISPDEAIAHRTCGAATPDVFLSMGETALNTDANMASYIEKYVSGVRDAEFIYNYARVVYNACLPPDEIVVNYLSEIPENDLKAESNWKIIKDYLNDYDSQPFQYLMNNKEEFAKIYTKESVEEKIFSVYKTGLFSYEAKNDLKGLTELKSKIRETGNPDAEKIILTAELNSYERKKQWDKYADAAEIYAKKYVWNDPNALNNLGWSFFENIENRESLEKALTWVERSIEIEEDYYNTDTYAALHYKLGNKAEAQKAAERAIAIAYENGEDPKETMELLGKINSLN